MEIKSSIFLLVLFIASAIAIPTRQTKGDRVFELNEVIGSGTFSFKGFNGTWISDNEFSYRNENGDLEAYAVDTDQHRVIVSAEKLTNLNASSYTLSPDQSQLLIRYDIKTIFRHSTTSKFKILNLADEVVTDVAEATDIQICLWAPVGGNLVYVKENDVYYRLASGVERRLTFDGVPGEIYNGVPDWVYEEEVLQGDGAIWFSPDGNKLVIASFNDTLVQTFTFHMYGEPGSLDDQYPELVDLKYPKAGTTNPTVRLSLIDLTDVDNQWQEIPAPIDQVTDDHIISAVEWASNDQLLAAWVNRRQNFASIQSCNSLTLTCNEVISMSTPNGWIEAPIILLCSELGDQCFYLNGDGSWPLIASVHLPTGLVMPVTSGTKTVLDILGYRASTNDLFYVSTTETNPNHRHVYQNNDCITCNIQGPEGELCTYVSSTFSEDFSYYTVTCSGPTPSYTRIYSTATNEEIKSWQENTEVRERLTEYQSMNIQYLNVPVGGGFEAAVKFYLPEEIDFEATVADKKYPMIVYVYGGPNSVRVTDSFGIGFQNYLVTNRKVIYCQIDGRGSGNKGNDMLFSINNHLGTYEIEDQIAVTTYLQGRFPFIDRERIGIWGWSYGGYATAMAISKDSDRIFQCGISVAPVTSWIYYDSIYTERYMGLPTVEDNLAGYNVSDVTRRVEDMRNHDFMLIHGNGDDNVHFQQAMALSRALQLADILFQQMSYPDEAHGLYGVLPHLYMTMDDFWTNCLNIGADE